LKDYFAKGTYRREKKMPGMDQRELESRVKALTKVVAANEPPENALKLLETLKKDASPTEEMLRVGVLFISAHR
jgi:hypothetical protein